MHTKDTSFGKSVANIKDLSKYSVARVSLGPRTSALPIYDFIKRWTGARERDRSYTVRERRKGKRHVIFVYTLADCPKSQIGPRSQYAAELYSLRSYLEGCVEIYLKSYLKSYLQASLKEKHPYLDKGTLKKTLKEILKDIDVGVEERVPGSHLIETQYEIVATSSCIIQ